MARTRAEPRPGRFLALAIVLAAGAAQAGDGGPVEPPPGTTWRYRDARGQLHLTDNPEGIPAPQRRGATTIAPLTEDEQRQRQVPSKLAAPDEGGGGKGGLSRVGSGSSPRLPKGLPVTAVAVYGAESLLLWMAARGIGLLVDLPAVALACGLAAALRWLDVPLLSSVGAFLVLVFLVWRLGRAESLEVGLLFLVVAALVHLLTLWALLRLPSVTVG